MNITIKRNKLEYFVPIIFSLPLINALSRVDWDNIRIIDAANSLLAILLMVFFVRLLINPTWIQIENDVVTVYNSILGKKRFDLKEIESVSESEGYSFKLLIRLQNGKIVKVNYFDLKNDKKDELIRTLRSKI